MHFKKIKAAATTATTMVDTHLVPKVDNLTDEIRTTYTKVRAAQPITPEIVEKS